MGMDYQPMNPMFHYLSDWMKSIFSGDYQAFLTMIQDKSDEEINQMLAKRETLSNVSAIFHVIIGARVMHSNDLIFVAHQNQARQNLNVKNEHMKILIKLLSLGCDVKVRDFAGYTPLHHCCSAYANEVTLKMAERLIRAGADVNAQNRFGCTALHEGSLSGRYDIVTFLLDNGADPYIEDNDNGSPATLAQINPKLRGMFTKAYKKKVIDDKETNNNVTKCVSCNKTKSEVDIKKCTGCFSVWYCGVACQREHWSQHSETCKTIKGEYKTFTVNSQNFVAGISAKGKVSYEWKCCFVIIIILMLILL